jgi:tetratricopeptide (TPR) repeat protein
MKKTLILLWAIIFITTQGFSQKNKKALLIAISDYQYSKSWESKSSLNSSIFVEKALSNQGFNILPLHNKVATKDGITQKMRQLINDAKKDDIIVIHYAGHGHQVVGNKNETDGMDEAIVPYDALPADSEKIKSSLIIDDDIGAWIKELRQRVGENGEIFLILDCCHSGTGDRGRGNQTDERTPIDNRGSINFSGYYDLLKVDNKPTGLGKYVLFTGSDDKHRSYEFRLKNGQNVGGLSYSVAWALNNMNEGESYSQLFDKVKLTMSATSKKQVPTIEGDYDKKVFGGKVKQSQNRGNYNDLILDAENGDEVKGETYAVVIGVSKYKNIEHLIYAEKDASYFAGYLLNNLKVPQKNIHLFTDSTTERSVIMNKLAKIGENLKLHDRVYFYFAGHGDTESGDETLLLLHDSPKRNYFKSSGSGFLKLSELKAIFEDYISKHDVKVIFIADACHAGGLVGGEKGQKITALQLNDDWKNFIKILSCQPNENSKESEKFGGGRGLFSYHLIQGLQGLADGIKTGEKKNNVVTLGEVEKYVKDKVNKFNPKQNPEVRGNKDFVIADVIPGTIKEDIDYSDFTNEKYFVIEQFLKQAKYKADETTKKNYELFQSAFEKNNLILPENNCALYYFEKIPPLPEYREGKEHLKNNLVKALQVKANSYFLEIEDRNISLLGDKLNQKTENSKIKTTIRELQVALNLMGKTQFDYPRIEAMKTYLEVKNNTIPLQQAPCLNEDQKKIISQNIEELEKVSQSYSKLSENFYELGYLNQLIGNDKKVIDNYNEYLRLVPNNARAYHNLAVQYNRQKKYDIANQYYQKSLFLDSLYNKAYYNWGNSLNEQQKYNEALKLFQKAITIDSTTDIVYIGIGNSYSGLKDYDKAIIFFQKAIKFNPDNAEAYFWLGCSYHNSGLNSPKKDSFDEAIDNLKKFININRKTGCNEYLLIDTYINLGSCFAHLVLRETDNLENYILSYLYYQKAIWINPNYPNIPQIIFSTQYKNDIKNIIKLIKEDTRYETFTSSSYLLAQFYSEEGDINSAIYWLKKSLRKKYLNEDGSKYTGFDYCLGDLEETKAFDNIRQTPQYKSLIKKYFPDN